MATEMLRHHRPDPQPEDLSLLVKLRLSMEVWQVSQALQRADLVFHDREPMELGKMHNEERRRYENAALMAVMLVNRDAQLFAENAGADSAFAEMEQFCKDNGLDWLSDTNAINEGDEFETAIHAMAKKAIKRFQDVLNGTYPGLSRHLERLRKQRTEAE